MERSQMFSTTFPLFPSFLSFRPTQWWVWVWAAPRRLLSSLPPSGRLAVWLHWLESKSGPWKSTYDWRKTEEKWLPTLHIMRSKLYERCAEFKLAVFRTAVNRMKRNAVSKDETKTCAFSLDKIHDILFREVITPWFERGVHTTAHQKLWCAVTVPLSKDWKSVSLETIELACELISHIFVDKISTNRCFSLFHCVAPSD